MNNSFKLLEALEMIENEAEWKKLERFFKQFNAAKLERSKIIFRELKKAIPKFSDSPIPVDKEKLSKKIFKKVAIKQLDNYFSDLSKHVMQFLILQELEKDKEKNQEMTSYVSLSRNAPDMFFDSLTDEIKLAEESNDHSLWRYNKLFEAHFRYFFHPYYGKTRRKQYILNEELNKEQDPYLSKSITYLDEFFVLTTLRLACETLNRPYNKKEEYNILLLNEVLQIAKARYLQHPSINLYYQIYQLTTNNSLYPPLMIKDLFKGSYLYLSRFERGSVFTMFTNMLTRIVFKVPSDENKRAIFDFYQIGIEDQYYEVDKNISSARYINIVLYGGFLKELEWTSNFMEQYKMSLPEEERESAYQLCRAVIAFNSNYEGQWDDMLTHLRNVKVGDNISLNLRVRTYQIIAFVESEFLLNNYMIPADDSCNNFKAYLDRNGTGEGNNLRYNNFINGVKILLRPPIDDKVYEEYKNMEMVNAHNWLMRTMDRVRKKPTFW